MAYEITSDIGKAILSDVMCSVSASTLRKNHLVGTVSRRITVRGSSGQLIYEVAWMHSQYGTSNMVHSHIVNGIENYSRLQSSIEQSGPTTRRRGETSNRVMDPYANSTSIALMLETS